jgi:hypothetical protein
MLEILELLFVKEGMVSLLFLTYFTALLCTCILISNKNIQLNICYMSFLGYVFLSGHMDKPYYRIPS